MITFSEALFPFRVLDNAAKLVASADHQDDQNGVTHISCFVAPMVLSIVQGPSVDLSVTRGKLWRALLWRWGRYLISVFSEGTHAS
jgi:hypothetical protein